MRLLFTLAFLILTSHSLVWGQGICSDPRFESGGFSLNNTDFCHDENIIITNTGGIEEARYYLGYRGQSFDEVMALGSQGSSLSLTAISKSGIYTVIQVGKKDGKETVSCISDVKVRVSNQPVFSYNFCPGAPSKLTVSIPSIPEINNHTSYTINISGFPNNTVESVTSLPYSKTFDVTSNAVSFTVTGSGGAKTCNSPEVPVSFNFNPSSGTKLDYFPNISQIRITEDDKIQIDLSGEYGQTYTLKRYSAGSIASLASVVNDNIGPGRYIDSPALANTTSYCYFVDKNNAGNCGTIVQSSAELCTVPLLNVAKTSITQNLLRWLMYRWLPTHRYPQLSQINPPTITIQKIESGLRKDITSGISTAMFSYSDTDIHCSKKYCYRVKVNTSGRVTGVNYSGISYSNEICVDHKKDPFTAPENVRVSTTDALQNRVYFEKPPTGDYPLDKWILLKSDGTNFLQAGEANSSALEISDNDSPVTRSETYKLKYQDVCENESELSNPISSVFLSHGVENQLKWNTSSPFSDSGINQYEIIYINDDTNQEVDRKAEPSSSSSHTIDTKQFTSTGTFKIRAVSADGKESFSNPISIPIKGALYMPTAFTPDGKGPEDNEVFAPKGSLTSIKEFLMEIFAITGAKIAEISDPLTGWDGKSSNGTDVSTGVYFYKMTAIMQNGQVINKNGSFALLK